MFDHRKFAFRHAALFVEAECEIGRNLEFVGLVFEERFSVFSEEFLLMEAGYANFKYCLIH